MHSSPQATGGPPAGSASATARASSARALAAPSPRPPSAVSRPPSAAAAAVGGNNRPVTPPTAAAAAAAPPPALSSLPSPRAASASAAAAAAGPSASHVVAAAATAAAAPAAAAAVENPAGSRSRPESPSPSGSPNPGHAVVPLVLPPQHQQRPQQQHQEIRAAHEMAGSSAGGGNADANAANPPAPHHPGFGPLDTTDPMLTTDAVVPYSQVLCDGDFHALYLLGERLGQGSYGTVHRCERRADGALFAVKVLALAGFRGEHRLPEIEDEVQLWRRVQDAHDSAVAEALAEAEAAGQVAASPAPSPPSPIVRLVSAHRDLTAAYLVQELCEGGDLQGVLDAQAAETIERAGLEARAAAGDEAAAQALAEAEASSSSSSARPGGFPGALPEPLAAAAMASALRFIAACHDAGVVFGDVKPSNFLLTLAEEEEEGEEQQGEGEAAAATTATATAPTTKPERRKRLLLRLRGADFGTALALPVDGVCSIHQGGCACADLAAFSLSTGGANNSRAPSRAGARSTSPAANEAVVAAAFAANGSGNSAGSPPAAPVYARECVPRRGLSGTPVYMAPELVRERRAGPAADVWAAGAMAYLLLTGRFPFWPDVDIADLARLPPARVLAEVAAAPLALEHPRATAHLSPEARGFLARLLERDPSRRVTARAALSHPFLAAAAREAAAPGGAAAAAQQAVVASR